MPISGAPRTRSARIASAVSARAARARASCSCAGSSVWSRSRRRAPSQLQGGIARGTRAGPLPRCYGAADYRHASMLRRALLLRSPRRRSSRRRAHAAGDPTMPLGEVRAGCSARARRSSTGPTSRRSTRASTHPQRRRATSRRARILITRLRRRRSTRPASGPASRARRSSAPARDGVAADHRRDLRDGRRVRRQGPCSPRRSRRSSASRSTRRASRSRRARAATLRAARARSPTPLTIGGLSPSVGALLQRAARRAGRTVLLAPPRARRAAQAPRCRDRARLGVRRRLRDRRPQRRRDRHRHLRRRRPRLGASATRSTAPGGATCSCRPPTSTASSTTRLGRRHRDLQARRRRSSHDRRRCARTASSARRRAHRRRCRRASRCASPRATTTPGACESSCTPQLADERAVGFPTGFSALSSLARRRPSSRRSRTGSRLAGAPERRHVHARHASPSARSRCASATRYVGGGGDADALAAGADGLRHRVRRPSCSTSTTRRR